LNANKPQFLIRFCSRLPHLGGRCQRGSFQYLPQIIQLPSGFATELARVDAGMGHHRLFIIAVCAALTVALQYALTRALAAACGLVDDSASGGLGNQ
jgi:hypothetical protein